MIGRILAVLLIGQLMVSCVSHDLNKPIVCSAVNIGLILVSVVNASDCGVSDGQIYVAASGGDLPYQFSLNGQPYQSGNFYLNLNSGIYSISVQDASGCTASLDNISVLATGFQFSATVQPDTECLTNNGSILINVLEGTAPYSYKLNNGDFTTNNLFTELSPGQYKVTLKDADACAIELNITVPRTSTETSWTNDILPIMTTRCATNGCHNGVTKTDYRIYNNAKKDAINIKAYTQDGSMPFGGPPLSQSQIDRIACWVDDGTLNN